MAGDLLFARCGFGAEANVSILDISQFTRMFEAGDPGDMDHSKTVDMTDAIIALQVIGGLVPMGPVFADADINGDQRIGPEEACFALQKAAGL